MKQIFKFVGIIALLFIFNEQASAAFSSGDLIQVVYQANGSNEVAIDLGAISSLGGLTTAYSGATLNLSGSNLLPLPGVTGAFSTAQWSDLNVAYYVYGGTSTSPIWLSGSANGQSLASRKSSNLNRLGNINGQYALSGTDMATLAMVSDPSYYFTMDKGGQGVGYWNGSLLAGSDPGEQNLGALANAASYVESYLYYYANEYNGGVGTRVATLRIYADGHTEIVATTAQYSLAASVSTNSTGYGTLSSPTPGVTCNGSSCSGSLSAGTAVTLTADAGTYSTAAWTGDCDSTQGNGTGTATCVINSMNAAKNVTATFTLSQYAITVSAAGVNGGTITDGSVISAQWNGVSLSGTNTRVVNYGAGPDAITATADSGVNVTWTGDCDGGMSGNGTGVATCNIGAGISSAKNVTATFTPAVATTPSLISTTFTAVTDTTATGGGTIASNGGSTVTDKGVCWNTSGSPTKADSCTNNCSGGDTFTCSINSLAPDTQYHLRPYATNSTGNGYGPDQSFFTQSVLTVNISGNGSVSDGNTTWTASTSIKNYDHNTAVVITASPGPDSYLSSLSGACNANTASCNFTMDVSKSETATFDLMHVRIYDSMTHSPLIPYYGGVQAAYDSVAAEGEWVQMQAMTFNGPLTFSGPHAIELQGGFASDYSSNPGFTTLGNSSITISGGTVTVENLIIQ